MKLIKCLRMALNMVLHSKLRSWLTILGIVIGVASVIAIVGIGDGMEAEINSQIGDLDGDILTITAGYSKASFGPGRHNDNGGGTASNDEITKRDLQVLKGISDIDEMYTTISGSVDVKYLGEEGSVTLKGVDQKTYSKVSSTDFLTGRNLDPADSNVILIGEKLATEFFEKEIGINQMLEIEGKAFRVVGVMDDSSRSIIMPINMAYTIIDDSEKDIYDSIVVKVKDVDNIDLTEETITKKLMNSRHVNENDQDFTVSSNAAINEMRSEMLSTMTTFLTAIAAVSLVVGAVGIANTMFTSVLEKTKEIGIMKAIGARNPDIMYIFIFNAGLIGLVGGLIGVALGYLLGIIVGMLGMSILISTGTVLITISISIGIGMISGIIPAYNASQLKPVDALRTD